MSSVSEIAISIIFSILLCGLSTIGNTTVLFVLIRRKDFLTISNYIFASLSFGNLIVGLFYPLQCLVDLGIVSSKIVCLPFLYSLLVLAYVVIWSLLALTVERYLTITCPLTACRVLSEKKAVATIILIYSFSVICGAVVPVLLSISAPPTDKNSCRFVDLVPSFFYRLFLLANRLVSVVVFIVIYGRVFVVMRKHMRAIAVQIRPALQATTEQTYYEESTINTLEVRHETGRWRRQVRPTFVLFVVVFYHSISWIPQAFAMIDDIDKRNFMVLTVTHFATYSSAAINPLLYGISNRQFRRALVSVFFPFNEMGNN